MNLLKAGFSRVNATPPLGIGIRGYFKPRIADGVLDELEINTLALAVVDKKVLLISFDNCGMSRVTSDWFRAYVAEQAGVDPQAVFISCTHTHQGPFIASPDDQESDTEGLSLSDPLIQEYSHFARGRMADGARMALADLQDAKMGFATGIAPHISFVRRFRMKDGSVATNPGPNNPNVVGPIGEVDERVHVLRFDREKDSLILVNFGTHPDVIGGNKISADWPGFLRRTVEKTLDNTKCIFFNGAQGDVNHVNVFPKGGDENDMFLDFDDVPRGYAHSRYMGRVVAGGVLQAFDKVEYKDVDSLRYAMKEVAIPSQMPRPEELPEAHRINDLHQAGRDADLPWRGMMLTTKVAEAGRMVKLEHGPDHFDMHMSAVAIGDVALVGIPGEPFTGIGLGLKAAEGWRGVLPVCLTNGGDGYFPMKEAYDEGGYETQSSPFAPETAQLLITEGCALLDTLR